MGLLAFEELLEISRGLIFFRNSVKTQGARNTFARFSLGLLQKSHISTTIALFAFETPFLRDVVDKALILCGKPSTLMTRGQYFLHLAERLPKH